MTESLVTLFNEKKAKSKKVEKQPVIKKVKKKDLPVVPIYEKILQYYESYYIDNIRIYNGVMLTTCEKIKANTEFFKLISPDDIFTELLPSTLNANGEFTHISFKEEDFIKTLDIPPIEYASILKIGCNFGEIYTFPNPFINHHIKDMVKSIVSLENIGPIKIGCSCNPLLDTNEVLMLVKKLHQMTPLFVNLFDKYIKDRLRTDKIYKKTGGKLISKFILIQNYSRLSDEDIHDLFVVINKLVPNEPDAIICRRYIEQILEIISVFTDYEDCCTCANLYTKEHNLVIDKDILLEKLKSSTRGRKPKEKKKGKRKTQGTGNYMSSQISFEVYNFINKKITKIKLFRNGTFQVPGIKNADMSDSIDCIHLLKNYLNYIKLLEHNNIVANDDTHELKKVVPVYIMSVMRNYICELKKPNVNIIINELKEIFYYEKSMSLQELNSESCQKYIDWITNLNLVKRNIIDIFKYANVGFCQISEISLNSERYSGILIKFLRPTPKDESKKITVKIMSSGKINIDGGNSEIEVFEIYYWLRYIFGKYWSEITYDSDKVISDFEESADSESGYESIYDDQL